MARIRTIKPVFWHDELVGAMPATARLTFIGLFSLADDEGRMRGSAAYVRSQVFTYDEDTTSADVEQALLLLHNARRIRIYGDGVQRYVEVVNFRKHQRIDKPQPSQLPAPGRHYPVLPVEGNPEQEIMGTIDDHSQNIPRGSGVERTGMEGIELKLSSPAAPSTAVARKATKKGPSEQVVACFQWYSDLWGKHGAFALELTTKRARAIEKALKEHGSEKVAVAIRGHHTNPWRHEQLNRNDIAVLLRPENIEAGVELAAKSLGARPEGAVAAPSRSADAASMGYDL